MLTTIARDFNGTLIFAAVGHGNRSNVLREWQRWNSFFMKVKIAGKGYLIG